MVPILVRIDRRTSKDIAIDGMLASADKVAASIGFGIQVLVVIFMLVVSTLVAAPVAVGMYAMHRTIKDFRTTGAYNFKTIAICAAVEFVVSVISGAIQNMTGGFSVQGSLAVAVVIQGIEVTAVITLLCFALSYLMYCHETGSLAFGAVPTWLFFIAAYIVLVPLCTTVLLQGVGSQVSNSAHVVQTAQQEAAEADAEALEQGKSSASDTTGGIQNVTFDEATAVITFSFTNHTGKNLEEVIFTGTLVRTEHPEAGDYKNVQLLYHSEEAEYSPEIHDVANGETRKVTLSLAPGYTDEAGNITDVSVEVAHMTYAN